MAVTSDSSSLAEFFEELLFTAAYLQGTRGLAELAKKILARRKSTAAAIVARNEAKDELTLADVGQALAWSALDAPLRSFDVQVKAALDPDVAAYKKVFPKTVPMLLEVAESDRGDALKPVIAFAKKSGHTGKLAAVAKELIAGWDAYAAASAAKNAAETAYDEAIAKVSAEKHAGVVAMREVDGTLRAKFASEPGKAKQFFITRRKKADEAAAAAKKAEKERLKAEKEAAQAAAKAAKEAAAKAARAAKSAGKKRGGSGEGGPRPVEG